MNSLKFEDEVSMPLISGTSSLAYRVEKVRGKLGGPSSISEQDLEKMKRKIEGRYESDLNSITSQLLGVGGTEYQEGD